MVSSAVAHFERLCDSRPAPARGRPMFFLRYHADFCFLGGGGGEISNFGPFNSL